MICRKKIKYEAMTLMGKHVGYNDLPLVLMIQLREASLNLYEILKYLKNTIVEYNNGLKFLP